MKRKQIIIPLITLIVLVLTVSVVTAAPKPPMGAFWGLVGNGGTDSTNFLGTTDDQDIVFKRNNDEIMRIEASGIDADGYTEWGSNLLTNSIDGNAATATALAANPDDCSANNFAHTIGATGSLTCAQLQFSQLGGFATDGQIPDNITINFATTAGTATLAAALVANGGNCTTAGQFAKGVDASGNAEGCATPAGGGHGDPGDCVVGPPQQFAISIVANGDLTCAAITDADVPNNITIDLAATATALAANPDDCSAGDFANAIDAEGDLTCAQVNFNNLAGTATDAQIPNNITIDFATTAGTAAAAAALVADGTNCTAGQFPKGVDISGNAQDCSAPAGTASFSMIGGVAAFTPTSSTKYVRLFGGFTAPDTTEGNTQHPMIGGDVSKLFVRTQAAPGVALLVTVHKDTGGGIMTTALTCTVPSGMTTCSDITHSATFADGDLFSLEVDPDGTTTPSVIRFHYVLKF